MEKLLNIWLPHGLYKALSAEIKNPVIFACVRDGRPTLEMRNSGDEPGDGFNQFMFLRLPSIPKVCVEEAEVVEKEEGDE